MLGCAGGGDVAKVDVPPHDVAPQIAATCVVTRIVDGDTFTCRGGRRVRLLLIDTPELSQGGAGQLASATLQRIAPPGTSLGLEYDVRRRDDFDRTLAYAWLDERTMLNEALLAAGVAVVEVYPPNVKYVDRFRAIHRDAERARVGLWASDAFRCTPRDHRRGRC